MNRLPKNPELSNVETAVERFLAALFRCLADGMNPPGNQNYLVPLAAMYDGESRAVFKTLIAFAECGVRPTLAALRAVASEVGYRGIEKILNPYNSDLIDRLPLLESTGAGLHNFAAIVIQAHRRREQVRRLHHRLSRLQDDLAGLGSARQARSVGLQDTGAGPVRLAQARGGEVRLAVA